MTIARDIYRIPSFAEQRALVPVRTVKAGLLASVTCSGTIGNVVDVSVGSVKILKSIDEKWDIEKVMTAEEEEKTGSRVEIRKPQEWCCDCHAVILRAMTASRSQCDQKARNAKFWPEASVGGE